MRSKHIYIQLANCTCTELFIWVTWMGLLNDEGTRKYFKLIHLPGIICDG